MLRTCIRLILSIALVGSIFAEEVELQFDKVELRTTFGRAKQGVKGRLNVTPERIQLVNRRPPRTLSGKRFTYFSIPSRAVTDLFYSRVSGRRIKLTSFLAPFFPILLPLLFTKGNKHYLTISFDDGKHLVGAIELKLHKSNYRRPAEES